MEILAYYYDLLSERRKTMQSTLHRFFSKKKSSLPAASATDEPLTSDEPQPGTSTGGYTRPHVPSLSLSPPLTLPSSSDVDDPNVF